MNKEEIVRICSEYNRKLSYAKSFKTSLDLGLVNEVLPLLQENIPTLPGQVALAWKEGFNGIAELSHLEEVVQWIPTSELRIVAIQKASKGNVVSFTFDFNFASVPAPGVHVQGVKVVSFGLTFSVRWGNREPLIRKLMVRHEKSKVSKKIKQYRKAS